MSQQINLLVKKAHAASPAAKALIVIAVEIVILLGYGWVGYYRLHGARQAEADSAKQLQEANAKLHAKEQLPLTDLSPQILSLTAQAEAAQGVLSQTASLGTTQGLSKYFSALASVGEEGLWLTRIDVNGGGKGMLLSGYSMRQESVVHYVDRLNSRLLSEGIQFKTLEMVPIKSGNPNDPKAQVNIVAFNLS